MAYTTARDRLQASTHSGSFACLDGGGDCPAAGTARRAPSPTWTRSPRSYTTAAPRPDGSSTTKARSESTTAAATSRDGGAKAEHLDTHLTKDEGASQLRVCKRTVETLMSTGQLGYVKVGRCVRIPSRAVTAY